MQAPDFETRVAILRKKAAAMYLKLDNEVTTVASDVSVENADFHSPDPTKKPKSIIGKNFDKRGSTLEEE